MIYERRHTRMISDFGGLAGVMPNYAAIFVFITLASIGLPGLSGFVAEFLVIVGAFGMEQKIWAVLGASGMIFGALYMLTMVARVFFGPVTHEKNKALKDLSARELAVMAPIVLFVLWMGLSPGTFLSRSAASVEHLVAHRHHYTLALAPSDTRLSSTEKPDRGTGGLGDWGEEARGSEPRPSGSGVTQGRKGAKAQGAAGLRGRGSEPRPSGSGEEAKGDVLIFPPIGNTETPRSLPVRSSQFGVRSSAHGVPLRTANSELRTRTENHAERSQDDSPALSVFSPCLRVSVFSTDSTAAVRGESLGRRDHDR
jgi:hypothetical protein